MEWLVDREKDGERYTNTTCLVYCLKCFRKEKKVELWKLGLGYLIRCKSEAEALFLYRVIKGIGQDQTLLEFVAKNGTKIDNPPF